MRSRVVAFLDLDGTLIHSLSAAERRGERLSPRLPIECVESLEGRDISWTDSRVPVLLAAIAGHADIVPTTTRTQAQFARIRLPAIEGARVAIVANGAQILVGGRPDDTWAQHIRTLRESLTPPPAQLIEIVRDHQARLGLDLSSVNAVEAVFVYAVARDVLTAEALSASMLDSLECTGWGVSRQGRKVYVVPRSLTKAIAADYVLRTLRSHAEVPATSFAAGDARLDQELLQWADRAVVPRSADAELKRVLEGQVEVTRCGGFPSAVDILLALQDETRHSSLGVAPLMHTNRHESSEHV